MAEGYVVDEATVEQHRLVGDTATSRTTIDARCGCERLEQRVIRFASGRSSRRTVEAREEVLYVASGSGTLLLDGEAYPLEPETAAYLVPGDRYEIDNAGADELVLVSVSAPVDRPTQPRRRTVRLRDQPPLPAAGGREFRYLVNQDVGCEEITQFVGVIPPGRAPAHSHTYDEVIYVVEGEGVLHMGAEQTRIAAGSCIHLPPLLMHCLENTGARPMRVLGVFHPSGDPASRAREANQPGRAGV